MLNETVNIQHSVVIEILVCGATVDGGCGAWLPVLAASPVASAVARRSHAVALVLDCARGLQLEPPCAVVARGGLFC